MSEWVDPDSGRDFRTVIPPGELEAYYSALGKFMHMFARAENDLNATLSNFVTGLLTGRDARTPDLWIIKGILGGQRVGPLIDTLKRLLHLSLRNGASQAEIEAHTKIYLEVETVLNHLSEIHYLRDRLAHNGSQPDMRNKKGWWGTANSITVREIDQFDIMYFSPQHLLDAARDLEIMPNRLHYAMNPESAEFARQQVNPNLRDYVDDVLGPWRYKASDLRREGPKVRGSQRPRPRKPKE